MPNVFLNPNLPDYFLPAPEVTSASNARSYVGEYEDAKLIYFPNLKPDIDHAFWANLNAEKHPALKKLAVIGTPNHDIVEQHRQHLRVRGLDQALTERMCDQIQAIFSVLSPALQAVFADYEIDRQKVRWRLSTIMATNMGVGWNKIDLEQHIARMFVNLDTEPHIWHTSWTIQDMVRQAKGRIPPEELEGLSRGEVWRKLNATFFGQTSRQWWDQQPRHVAFFDPGDVWVVNPHQVSHQIFYGRRSLLIDCYVPKENMKNPNLHYLNIADRFRAENRQAEPLTPIVSIFEIPRTEISENITTIGLKGFLRQASKRLQIRAGDPPLVTLSKVIAHPNYTALYDAEGRVIPESSMYIVPPNAPQFVRDKFRNSNEITQFEPETIPVSDLEVSKDTVTFAGAPNPHFGHHLLDGMSRLWHHSTGLTLSLDAHLRLPRNHGFISEYRALGRPRRFYDLQKPTLFETVILPHASIQNGFLMYGNSDAEHLAITRAALEQACRPVASKIYLSRKGIANRQCHGEEELEDYLSAHGFAIVTMHTLPVIDQISIFNHADWIVGPIASSFHNVLFTRRGASIRTVQLTYKKPDLRFMLIDRVKGHTSYYAQTMSYESVGSRIISTHVDVEESVSVLREIGALEPPTLFGYSQKYHWPRKGLLGLKDRLAARDFV